MQAFEQWKRQWKSYSYPTAPDPQLDAIKIANRMRMNQKELDELLALVNTIVPLFLGDFMNSKYLLRTETWDGILESQPVQTYEELKEKRAYAWRNRNVRKIMIYLRKPHGLLQLLHTQVKRIP
jgi:hypothetical protein